MDTPETSEQPSSVCDSLTLLRGPSAFTKHLCSNLAETSRKVDILTLDLDRLLYGDESVCNAISKVARGHAQSHIRILVKNPRPALENHHRLIALQQRLTSKIEIRQLAITPENESRGYSVCDNRSILLQHNDGEYDGFCNTDARPEAQALLEEFDQLWDRQSNVIEELKDLRL